MESKSAKTRIGVALCAASILGLAASGAIAGEITGNGKWIAGSPDAPLNGKSACAYSGQEEDPTTGQNAQSWGLIPKVVRAILTSIGMNPGIACNPTKASGEP
jgi:hypothetical protein